MIKDKKTGLNVKTTIKMVNCTFSFSNQFIVMSSSQMNSDGESVDLVIPQRCRRLGRSYSHLLTDDEILAQIARFRERGMALDYVGRWKGKTNFSVFQMCPCYRACDEAVRAATELGEVTVVLDRWDVYSPEHDHTVCCIRRGFRIKSVTETDDQVTIVIDHHVFEKDTIARSLRW